MYESKKMRNLVESVKKVLNGENINEGKVTVPANLMKEFEKLMGKRSSSDQRKLSKLHGLLMKGEIDKAWDEYEDLDDDLRLNVVTDRIVQFMDQNLSR